MGKESEKEKSVLTPRETEQRSYFLPKGLGDAFKEFCMGNASTGARGAFILFMACRKFPDLRERASRAAEQTKISEAIEEIERQLIRAVEDRLIEQWAKSLSDAERAKILAEAQQRKTP